MEFLLPLHRAFTARQQELALQAHRGAAAVTRGQQTSAALCFPSDAVRNGWRITLPEWCQDCSATRRLVRGRMTPWSSVSRC